MHVTTDSIINIEFDNWTTLNTLCNIGRLTLHSIGCQSIKLVPTFDLSKLTCAMKPVVVN